MSIVVKHAFTSPKAEQTDSTLVGPNEWNANHTIINTTDNYYASDYNFTVIQPGGTLTSGITNTITLPNVPLGLNGTDSNHYLYISSGTGTAEVVLVTGGSAVSGGISQTISFVPANNHSGAWTIGSATAGIQEALQLGITAGSNFQVYITQNCTLQGPVKAVGVSNFRIQGIGNPTVTFLGSRGFEFDGAGLSLGVNTTGNYSSIISAPATPDFTTSFVVTSSAGYSIGNLMFLNFVGTGAVQGGTGTFIYTQITPISGISGGTITPLESIRIPLSSANTDSSNSMSLLTTVSNITIDGFTIDGTGGTINNPGILMNYTSGCRITNMHFNNINGAGILAQWGYRNQYSNLTFYNTGNGGYAANYHWYSTGIQHNNINLIKCAFGFQHQYCTAVQSSNITFRGGTGGRGMKMTGTVWSSFSNLDISDCSGGSGISLQMGSYRNHFSNAILINSPVNGGIHLAGSSNSYNIFNGFSAYGSGVNGDIATYPTDHHNSFLNGGWGTNLQNGQDDTFGTAIRDRCMAFNTTDQILTNGFANNMLTWDSNIKYWDTTVTDNDGLNWSLTASSNGTLLHTTGSRFTNQGPPGFFKVTACWKTDTNTTGALRLLGVRVNGGNYNTVTSQPPTNQSANIMLSSQPIFLANGSYLEIGAVHDASSSMKAVGGNGAQGAQSWAYVERVMM